VNIQQQIEKQISNAYAPIYLKLENESHMHAGPASESHFKMVLVSQAFESLSRVKRHQAVYKVLADLMPQFHALALHTYSASEWQKNQQVPSSPLCAGVRG